MRPAKRDALNETVAVISAFYNLARTYLQLARRIWLANRIRKSASKASLGPHFRSVDISDSRMAVFIFEPSPDAERSTDEADRSERVLTFVKGLAKP